MSVVLSFFGPLLLFIGTIRFLSDDKTWDMLTGKHFKELLVCSECSSRWCDGSRSAFCNGCGSEEMPVKRIVLVSGDDGLGSYSMHKVFGEGITAKEAMKTRRRFSSSTLQVRVFVVVAVWVSIMAWVLVSEGVIG